MSRASSPPLSPLPPTTPPPPHPPVQPKLLLTLCLCARTEGLSGSWKEGGGVPSSSSSGYWSWSAPSDQSNPSTPSPPLSADSFKPFRSPAPQQPPDDGIDEAEASNLLFDEPIPRKRKVGVWATPCLGLGCRNVHLPRACGSLGGLMRLSCTPHRVGQTEPAPAPL